MFSNLFRNRNRAAKFSAFLIFLAAATFAAASSIPAFPQASEKLPTTQQVLDRYVTATGGRDALLRYKSMTMHGHAGDAAKNTEVHVVSYVIGNKSLQRAELPGGKVALSGYDGVTAWDVDPTGKVTIYDGDIVKTMARDADMYYHLHVMNYFRSMEVIDVKEFNGRPCYHLKGVNNWGKTNEQFYDKENGLLVGYAFNTAWRGGNGDATALFEDYKDFGGVLTATKNTSHDGADVSIFYIDSVTYDDVPDSAVALPDAVVKAKAAKTAAPK